MKALKRLTPVACAAILLMSTPHAFAAIDNRYYVIDAASKSHFDVYNDGRNTYIEAIPGLIVRGATADGQRFIVNGVPSQISAQLNGKQITVIRGMPPAPPSPPPVDPKTLLNRIEEISSNIKRIEGNMSATDSALAVNSVDVSTTADQPKEEEWIVPSGASMRDLVSEFASRAHWALDINFNDVQTGLPSDLTLGGGQRIRGSFKKAITEMFSAMPNSANVMAELRPDNDPPTLFIYRKGTHQ